MSSFQQKNENTNCYPSSSSISRSNELDNSSSARESNQNSYSHKLRTFKRNCSICGCIVYDTFGDQYDYYCDNHTKYDTAWQS